MRDRAGSLKGSSALGDEGFCRRLGRGEGASFWCSYVEGKGGLFTCVGAFTGRARRYLDILRAIEDAFGVAGVASAGGKEEVEAFAFLTERYLDNLWPRG